MFNGDDLHDIDLYDDEFVGYDDCGYDSYYDDDEEYGPPLNDTDEYEYPYWEDGDSNWD